MKLTTLITPYGDLQFPSDPLPGKSAICLSGGADSAILLYYLVKNGLTPNRIMTLNKLDGTSYSSASLVLEWINEQCGTDLKLETFERVEEGHSLKTDIRELGKDVDFMWIGVNSNPDGDDTIKVGMSPDRPPRNDQIYENKKFLEPFINFDKRITIWLYHHLGAEDLLARTWSCTEHPTIECQECFQCAERKWAIGKVKFDLTARN